MEASIVFNRLIRWQITPSQSYRTYFKGEAGYERQISKFIGAGDGD